MPETQTILIVDDRSADRRLLKKMLESSGYGVQEAADGKEGLEMAELHKPDLIIADTLMPVMDGFGFLRNIRKNEKTKTIPFILYSAVYTGYADEKLALSLGANAFIQKPIDTGEFLLKVGAAIRGVKDRKKTATKELTEEEEEYLRRYCQVVAAKLEEKVRELEETNEHLQLQVADGLRAEDALHKERDRTQHYLDVAGVALIVIGADRKASLVNQKGCEILGYEKEEEIIDKDWFDNFVPERLRDEMTGVFESLMAGEIEPVEYYENPVLTRDGEERIVAWHNTILRDEDGKIYATLCSGEDVTEHRRAEDALRKSEKQLKETKEYLDNIIESSADAVVVVDMDGTVRSWNRAAEDYMGYAADEVIGSSNRKFFADPEEPERIMEMVLRDGTLKNYRTAVLNNDRKPVQISLSASLLKDSEGVPIGTVRVSRDITKEVELEARIKEERDNLNLIFDSMVDGIYIVSKDYEIEFMNKVLIGEFGDRVGTICYKAFHDREEPCPLCKNQEVMNGETVHWEWNSGRRNRTYDLIETPLKNIDGTISKLTIFRDITERKRAEEKLLRVSRDREEIFQALGNAVIIIDPEFNILDANRPVMAATGMSAKELTGRKCYEISHRTTEPPENCPAKKLMASKDYKPVENDMEALGGIFLVSCTPVIEDGDLVKIIHTMTDITERKRAEEKLEKKIEELRRFNEMTVERELKMVELKKEINSLLRGVGKEPRYRILEEIDTGTSE